MKFLWRGVAYEAVDQSDMSWLEMEKLEEAAGVTTSELEDPKVAGRARVIAAMCWMSVQRQNEAVTFAEFFGSKISEFEKQDEGEEETVPPPPDNDPLDSAGMDASGSDSSGTST